MRQRYYKLNQRQQQEWEQYLLKLYPNSEAEAEKLLIATRRKLPMLKTLLAEVSDHGIYEGGLYRFYATKITGHRSRVRKIVSALQSLAPHLRLNLNFLEIVAEGTGESFGVYRTKARAIDPRTDIEAFLHAHHMLSMVCKCAETMPNSSLTIDYGWLTVLTLYNLR